MLYQSFTRPQLILLSGLKDTHIRTLEKKHLICRVGRTSIAYSWKTLVICTVLSSLRQLFAPKIVYKTIWQLNLVFKKRTPSSEDLYYFQVWDDYAIGYQKLTDLSQWIEERWIVRVLTSTDRAKGGGPIASLTLGVDGRLKKQVAVDETLICVYLKGIFECLLARAIEHRKLYDSISQFIK